MHERRTIKESQPVVWTLVGRVKQEVPLVSGNISHSLHEQEPQKNGQDIYKHGKICCHSRSIAVPQPSSKNVKKAQEFPQDFTQPQVDLLWQLQRPVFEGRYLTKQSPHNRPLPDRIIFNTEPHPQTTATRP
jgi:hypothetical protein